MVVTLLNLIQAPPQKTSLVVWIVAVVLFLAGVSMIVYFFTRLKKVDKEPEEDWISSRNTLFVAPTGSAKEPEIAASEAEPMRAVEEPVEAVEEPALKEPSYEEPPFVPRSETRELASEDFTGPSVTAPEEVTPWVPTEPRPAEVIEEPAPAERATQALGSIPSEAEPEEPAKESEAAVFDEEVWAGLEPSDQTASLGSVEPEASAPEAFARVDSDTSRAPFEPPQIVPINRREPFEPPRIEPLAPRGSEAAPRPPVSSKQAAGEAVPASLHVSQQAEPYVPAARHDRKVAGSVLGIPVESGKGPLILGTPAKSPDELGIGGLTNYGKDTSERAGHGGTIALALAILLVAGAVLSYFYIPTVHSRVDNVVARMRGRDPVAEQAAVAASEPKARIFPARNPEVVKNTVKARGAVDNISQQTLENLSVEISLERYGGGPADTLNVQVNPTPLAPAQRGIYEFPYDGKLYRGYSIAKLTSNGEEVKFITPKP